jgi:hypothetical protein
VNGSLVRVNPPADNAAIVQGPVVAGKPTACFAVGLVFATAWSGVVSKVTVTPRPGTPSAAGGGVDVTITLTARALSNPVRFESGAAGHFTVAVILQGSELGTATLRTGWVIVLPASRSVGTLIARQLGHSQS